MRLPGIASTVWFLAFVGVSLLLVRELLERPDAAPQAQVSPAKADDHYLCDLTFQGKVAEGGKPRPLIVKYSGNVATEILFEYTHSNRADAYHITYRDDVYYVADESSPDVPEAFASLRINRLSGEMETTSRISMEAVQLLTDICNRRIPVTECGDRMSRIKGGSWVACIGFAGFEPLPSFNESSCGKWRSGTNIMATLTHQCRRTERQFQ